MMKYLFLLMCLAAAAFSAPAQTAVQGTVVNAQTGERVGGASIRIDGTTKGTYTNGRGEFRLPLTEGAKRLVITSLGYDRTVITIEGMSTTISLTPSSVAYSSVAVVGEITPEEVIRRASDRVKENNARVSTVVSNIYSKMRFTVNADALQEDVTSGVNTSILETFSTVYERRVPKNQKHVRVLQRRQTKNIPAQDNLLVFDQFFDFTTPEVRFQQTRLVTPLAPDALDEYAYTLLGKEPLGNLMVYRITFEPKARMYPGFEGTLSIVEGTYQVIGAEFTPTDETAIPFVRKVHYTQRYEQQNDSIWVPMYQQATAKAGIDVIVGVLSVETDVSIETHVTDVQINVPIDDSLFVETEDSVEIAARRRRPGQRPPIRMRRNDRITSVAEDADSTRPEFWEQRAYAQQTEEEREAYRIADSVVAASPPREEDNNRIASGFFTVGPVGITVVPVIDRASITRTRYGGEFAFTLEPVRLTTEATFGSQGTRTGEVGLAVDLLRTRTERVTISGSVYTRIGTIQGGRSVFGRADFLNLSDLIYADWSDFYRMDGMELGAAARFGRFQASLQGSWHRALNMPVLDAPSRAIVTAQTGDFQVLTAMASYGRTSSGIGEFFGAVSPIVADAVVRAGRETSTMEPFLTAEVGVSVRVPTFATGYYPMRFDLDMFAGARLMGQLPRQYQFSLLQRYPVLGGHTDLATVPINAFGGTSYVRAHLEHNFTDLWWRALGLPTFANKRGIDIIGLFDAANVWQHQQSVIQGQVWDGTNGWYMEAGVALARIPTFISELFYLRVDALWPVGGLAAPRGSFGWSITVSSPLL